MELKMGCFVVMQSILFHRRLFAFTMPSNSKFFFLCQIPKVKAVAILSKNPDVRNTTEKFWLVLVVIKMSP